jgi:cytochrome P450
MKPSDFPREARFHDPSTPPFLEVRDGKTIAHVFNYADAKRVQLNRKGEFSQDVTAWLPPEQMHSCLYFMWATDPGKDGRHDVQRSLVEASFGRQATASMAPQIHQYARDLRRGIVEKGTGEFNLATEFGPPLSMQTICGLLGFPLDREEWLRKELDHVVRAPDVAHIPASYEVESFFWETVAKRRAAPKGELLDQIIAGWSDGRITDKELLGFMFGIIWAGTDTTGTNVVNAFALPAEFGQLDHLREILDDNAKLHWAIEEVLRFGTPFPAVIQAFTTQSVTVADIIVPPASQVLVHIAAANRDPAINGNNTAGSDPNVFDMERSPNHHMAFGLGPHNCLAGDLARLEAIIAWRELFHYLPGLSLDKEKPFKRFAGIVDCVTEACFTFDQQEAEKIIDAPPPAWPPFF